MPTGISYVDKSWNPICGCEKCSIGCLNCFAEELHNMRHRAYLMGKKLPKQYAKPFSKIQLFSKRLNIPLHWRKPRTILVCSMGDLFHPKVPFEFIDKVWDVMMYEGSWHEYLVLTKRPKKMTKYVQLNPYNSENIHLGITICTQKEADEILPIALQIPGFDWISAEPLLGPIDFSKYLKTGKINWVVIGCES